MIVTNHMEWEGLPNAYLDQLNQQNPDFIVLPGREVASGQHHMLALFDPVTWNPQLAADQYNTPECRSIDEIRDFIATMHSRGALTVLAHPHLHTDSCPPETKPTQKQWVELGLDFAERVTSGVPDLVNPPWPDPIRTLAGSDGHWWLKTGPPIAYTKIMAANFTPAAIFEQLRHGNITITTRVWGATITLGAIIIVISLVLATIAGVIVAIKACRG